MNDEQKRVWDVVIAASTPIIAVIGVLIGIHQFGQQESDNAQSQDQARISAARLEYQRSTWANQIEQYKAVGSVVGSIASNDDPSKMRDLISRFNALYWGTVILVEDAKVEHEMKMFEYELQLYKIVPDVEGNRLKQRAYELLNELKSSIAADAPKG